MVVQTACPITIPISIPNPASLVVMDPSGASGADKKRNKLGYSRTSVACVHCRRRKIRCLVSADDSEGRCENCIRLRKECQFYPVDQQPPTDRSKARPGMKMENTPTSSADPSIASSSPPSIALAGGGGAGGGASIDPSDIYHYQISMQSTATTPEMTATAFHPSGFPVAPMVPHPELLPSQTIDPNTSWETHPGMGNPSPVMWTTTQGQIIAAPPHPSSITPSPMTGGIPHQHPQMLSPAAAAAPFTVQPDGTLWPGPPQRAMTTIPSQGDMYQQHPGFASGIPPELKRSMTTPAGSRPQHSPLQSPSASPAHHPHLSHVPVQVNYPQGASMAFQQQPQTQQQWSNMNAIPMGDGSYTTMFPNPDHFPMGQHPTSGP